MSSELSKEALEQAFRLLSGRLDLNKSETVRLVVCGGSALIATGLRQRTTRDADVVALMNSQESWSIPSRSLLFCSMPLFRWQVILGWPRTGSTMGQAAMMEAFFKWAFPRALPVA